MNIPKLRFKEFEGEWSMKKLENVFKIKYGKDYKHLKIGKIVLIGTGGTMGYVSDAIYDKPSIIIGRKGSITKPKYIDVPFWCVDTTFYTEINNNYLPFFVYLVLSNIKWLKYNEATGVPSLNSETIKNIKSFFPTLPEQQKIADFLTLVDKKINALQEKKQLFEQYKKGIMQKIFAQEIRFKDENNEEFPDWEEKRLGEIANFRRGSFPQPYGLPEWYDDEKGMPFIQVYDVDDNMLLKPKTKNKISELGAKQSVFVKKGTLVITIQGSIGRIAKTQYDAYIDRTLLIFQSYKVKINVDYFKFVLFLLFEIEKTKAPGGTIKTITKEVLTEFKVQLPCFLEQQKIASFLSGIDEKISLLETQLTALQTWKKGLLQQMFI